MEKETINVLIVCGLFGILIICLTIYRIIEIILERKLDLEELKNSLNSIKSKSKLNSNEVNEQVKSKACSTHLELENPFSSSSFSFSYPVNNSSHVPSYGSTTATIVRKDNTTTVENNTEVSEEFAKEINDFINKTENFIKKVNEKTNSSKKDSTKESNKKEGK